MLNVTQCRINQEMNKKIGGGGEGYIGQGYSDHKSNPQFRGGGTIGQPCTYLICMVYDKCHAHLKICNFCSLPTNCPSTSFAAIAVLKSHTHGHC